LGTLTCEQHPDADRLKVTTVDIGTGTPVQIVCGAANAASGQKRYQSQLSEQYMISRRSFHHKKG
jgi:tRNA-binding EMAP/Myf-like protein